MSKIAKKLRFSPLQVLVLGYLLITLTGAMLLSLPRSNVSGRPQAFIDALFVSTSGISTSGLSPVDIGKFYTRFGQVVLLCIFQIGGIGYMTFVIFFSYLLGLKFSVRTGIAARESLSSDNYHMLGIFFRNVLLFTFIFEGGGALILTLYWIRMFPAGEAVYLGVFHSISAFCTAGFSTFSTSLMDYRGSFIINTTINIVSIAGGLGFFVLSDLSGYYIKKFKKTFPQQLTVHTKLALWATLIIMSAGTILIYTTETWPVEMYIHERLMISMFQSVSASTTDGFNSVDIGSFSQAGLTVLMLLMFIGASPGSTGGGMKNTTLGVMILFIKSYFQEKNHVSLFKRELPQETVIKALTVFSLFAAIALLDIIILANIEKASYLNVLFEVISALGNTGLSTGITASLSFAGKAVLIVTMFIGRVGPLTIGTAFIKKDNNGLLRYPSGDVFTG